MTAGTLTPELPNAVPSSAAFGGGRWSKKPPCSSYTMTSSDGSRPSSLRGVVNSENKLLAVVDIGRCAVVVDREPQRVEIGEGCVYP